jgi:predicted DNA-binding protein
MKSQRRTTVRLDEELREKLKRHCTENDKTIGSFISNAIKEKIDRESQEIGDESLKADDETYSLYALAVIDKMSAIFGSMTAKRIFDLQCQKLKIPAESFSERNLTREFIESTCKTYSLIASKEKVEELRERLNEALNL